MLMCKLYANALIKMQCMQKCWNVIIMLCNLNRCYGRWHFLSTFSAPHHVSISSTDTRCILGDGTVLFLNEVRVVLAVPPSNISRAADVILVVDESGSMVTEHQWIAGMTQDLDEALRAVNIGVEPRNLFGVVGFGADCLGENFTVGRVITNSADEVLSFGSMVNEFTSVLGTSGRMEDGYSGIRTALGGYEFRNGAKQFILITDEDRDPVDRNLTRESIQELLEKAGVVLNAAISEEFEGEGLRALGIDGARNAYVYDPSASALFSIVRGAGMPIQDSSHGSTSTDYTQLALELGGAAWDLSRLREGALEETQENGHTLCGHLVVFSLSQSS